MKKLLFSFLAIFAAVFLMDQANVCAAETDALAKIKKRGYVRVGVFSDKPPFGYVDKEGKNQGYDIYFAKRIAKDLLGDESKVKFELVEAASRVEVLVSDKVDITLANFTKTPKRARVIDFVMVVNGLA